MSCLNQLPDTEQLQDKLSEIEWLNDCQQEMLDLVVELCDTNSGTFNLSGLKKVASVLEREYGKLGGVLTRQPVATLQDVDDQGVEIEKPLGELIQIVKRPNLRPRALLCIHMDTVYPSSSPFQTCIVRPDGTINGPGVADAKGGLVVMLYSLLALERSSFANSLGWEVIINPDEELGSPGSAEFLAERASEADVGFLFEPTLPDGTRVSTRKGVGNFSFVVKGRSVHSGREFEKGRNAIVACCELMTRIHELNQSPEITYNVGKISGGTALNVVPDTAVGRVNVRVETVKQQQEVEQRFAELVEQIGQQDGISVHMLGQFTSPPKEMTPDLRLLQSRIEACSAVLGEKCAWRATGGASDGNKFAAAGLANIDTLGPKGGQIHSHDEFMEPASLVSAARLTALALLSFCNKD